MPINNTTNDLSSGEYIQAYTIGSQGQLQPRYIKLSDLSTSLSALSGLGYKRYICTITQDGTSDPTVTEIINELGGDVTWTRDNIGTYFATSAGLFTNYTQVIPPANYYEHGNIGNGFIYYSGSRDNDNLCFISTGLVDELGNNTRTDGLMDQEYSFVEIRVYD